MAANCIVFSLANPIPEVDPEMAARYAAVVATGRSDLPNQINNVLAFPGVFRGAIDAGARSITEEMKLAAAAAIADVVGDELRPGYIVPSPLDRRVATAVAEAVAACAREQGSPDRRERRGSTPASDLRDVADGQAAHGLAGGVPGAAQVRGEHDLGQRQQPRVDLGLVLEHVQRRHHPAGPARAPDQGVGVDDAAARGVHQHGARPHPGQRGVVDEVVGLGVSGSAG